MEESKTIQQMNIEAVHQLLQSDSQVMVIDVRTPEEYEGPLGHIEGALLKPLQEIEQWKDDIDGLKNRQIVLVCRSGGRSNSAAGYLQDEGFTSLVNAAGGMLAWNEKGFPVVK